jgi:hypothetical protein
VTTIGTAEGLAVPGVQAIWQAPDGAVWLGTRGGGVSIVRQGRVVRTLRKADGLASDSICAITGTRDGSVFLGGRGGGLTRIARDGTIRRWGAAEGLRNETVHVLLEDRAGNLWIGTNGGGLFRFDDGRFTHFGREQGISIEIVNTIHEEEDGTLWVGTYGGGLNRFRDGLFSAVTTREGLYDDAVFAILPDGQGNLWISCNRGIYAVSLRELDAVARGAARRVGCRPFGVEDGMRNRECNGANQPAGARGPDGRLHFPTIEGVVTVDPQGLHRNPVPPPVHVEVVKVDDVVESARSFLELPPGARRFEFQYTAPSLRVPSRVVFRVRLEGVDADWVEVGTRRTAWYTSLSPGSYTFRVAAANESGVWNENEASFAFRLKPRLDQRPFFWLVVGTFALAVAYTGYRFRVAQLEVRERELVEVVEERTRSLREEKERTERALAEAERQRERAEEAGRAAEEANRTKSDFLAMTSHELRTPLNAILGYSELLMEEISERRLPGLGEDVEKVHSAGRHLLGLINDLLDLSRGRRHDDASPRRAEPEPVRRRGGGRGGKCGHRPDPPAAGPPEPPRERRQVHARRRGRFPRAAPRRARGGPRPLLRDRHRDRHERGAGGAPLPGVRAGRPPGHPPLRRDGARPRHHAAPRPDDGGRRVRREPAGGGLDVRRRAAGASPGAGPRGRTGERFSGSCVKCSSDPKGVPGGSGAA